MTNGRILRGGVLSFTGDPFQVGPDAAVAHWTDGAVLIRDGHIAMVGQADAVINAAGPAPVTRYSDALILAGFIDAHVHYPQTRIIASYGAQLLEWLEKYTFPAEMKFADNAHARAAAAFYLDEALRNGITSASVYCTIHPGSVDALFEAATARGMRMIAGKMMMDRNAPDALTDTAQIAYDQSAALITRWHGRERCVYSLTPRFAPTSSPEQLAAVAALFQEHPDVLLQTHLAETPAEITWVGELFPDAPDYFGVYEAHGLVGPRAIMGHGIHLKAREIGALRETGTALAHCPTSNCFIGSGLFDLNGLRMEEKPLTVGLGTDVGGGSSTSMFATMRSAYEVAQLRGASLHPSQAFYLATQGGADALGLGGKIGNIAVGREADIQVIDLKSTPLITNRMAHVNDLWEALFVQMILADDRATRAVYIQGELTYDRDRSS